MSSPPPQICNATKQELVDAGLKAIQLCPGCKKYKVELEVMFHRDAAAVPVPVPAVASGVDGMIFARLEERLEKLQVSVTQLQARQPASSPSRSELGLGVWEACQSKIEGISEATYSTAPKPLFTQEELDALKAQYKDNHRSKEDVWVALVTPRLMKLVADFSPRKILVNSELIQWIRTEANLLAHYQKPDLFVCDPVAFMAHAAPRTTNGSSASSKYAASLRKNDFLFGSCAWPLRDALLCLLEAKVKIQLNNDIGEVFSKVQNLLRGTMMASFKCILFDMKSIYLLTFTSTGLLSSHHFSLVDPGSFQAVAEFIFPPATIEPMWLRTMRRLCAAFNVEPVANSAFLGSGAHGKVFHVQAISSNSANSASAAHATVAPSSGTSATTSFALKVVDHCHEDSLKAEHGILKQLLSDNAADQRASILPTFVSPQVKHVSDSSSHTPLGSGLLLQPVGRWVWAERSFNAESVLYEVLEALAALHTLGVIHGDARLENLLRVDNNKLVWIDFRQSKCFNDDPESQQLWDLWTCLDNFTHHYRGDRMPQSELRDFVEEYPRLIASGAPSSTPTSTEWMQFKQACWKKISDFKRATVTLTL